MLKGFVRVFYGVLRLTAGPDVERGQKIKSQKTYSGRFGWMGNVLRTGIIFLMQKNFKNLRNFEAFFLRLFEAFPVAIFQGGPRVGSGQRTTIPAHSVQIHGQND